MQHCGNDDTDRLWLFKDEVMSSSRNIRGRKKFKTIFWAKSAFNIIFFLNQVLLGSLYMCFHFLLTTEMKVNLDNVSK